MQMTETEIVRSYQHALNRTKQISILAELNACSKAQIRDILEKNGEEVPHYGNRYTGKVKEEPKKEPKRSSVRMSERKKKSDSSKMSTRLLKSEEPAGVIKSDEPTAKDWAEFGEHTMQGFEDGLKEAHDEWAENFGKGYEAFLKEQQGNAVVVHKEEKQKVPAEVIAITLMKINDLKKEMGAIQEEMDKLQNELEQRLKMCNRLSVWLDDVKKDGDNA